MTIWSLWDQTCGKPFCTNASWRRYENVLHPSHTFKCSWSCLMHLVKRNLSCLPRRKKRNNRHFPFKTSSFASDCKRLPSHLCIAMTRCDGMKRVWENPWHARNQSDKHMPAHRIMVRTAGQADSQKRTKLAVCLLIWQIRRKCSISISEWLFFLAATFGRSCSQGSTGGSNSPSFALFPLWENDHLCLASQRTLFWIHDNWTVILTLGMMIQR